MERAVVRVKFEYFDICLKKQTSPKNISLHLKAMWSTAIKDFSATELEVKRCVLKGGLSQKMEREIRLLLLQEK